MTLIKLNVISLSGTRPYPVSYTTHSLLDPSHVLHPFLSGAAEPPIPAFHVKTMTTKQADIFKINISLNISKIVLIKENPHPFETRLVRWFCTCQTHDFLSS